MPQELILVTAPKLQEDGSGTNTGNLTLLSLLADIPLLGATRVILVTAPKLQEDWIGTITGTKDEIPLGAAGIILHNSSLLYESIS